MRYSNKLSAISYLLMGLGIIMIVSCLFREKIETVNDLKAIKTAFSSSGFYSVKVRPTRYFTPRYRNIYYVHANSFRNDFEIMGKIGKDFDQDNFEKEVHAGDSITMMVPKSDFNNLSSKRIIRLFGISTNKTTYMNYNNCIDEYNNRVGFVLFGIILLIAGYFLMQRAKNKEEVNRLAFQQKFNDE